VTNIAAAILNARLFASEVVAMLKASQQQPVGPAAVPAVDPEEVA
jgi:hypothetical protein